MAGTAPKKLGKYDIVGILGKGAMGTVYEGYDRFIDRRVAIKTVFKEIVDAEEAVEMLGRFKREAQAAGRLNHPGVVSIYDYGETEDLAFIAMEFINGKELKKHFESDERFPIQHIVRIMCDILDALDHAHRHGVVHRDIKPANIMITDDGRVKVADFGVARIESSLMTQVGTRIGTPAYMSPEQHQGLAVDGRSDLFSAGVILYQFLTGERPFTGGGYTIIQQILKSQPIPPSEINISIPRSLDTIVSKALAKRAVDRFDSAREFAVALRKAAGESSSDVAIEPDGSESALLEPPKSGADTTRTDDGALSADSSTAGIAMQYELAFWREIRESTNPDDFSAFIDAFPNGRLVQFARRHLKKRETEALNRKHDPAIVGTSPKVVIPPPQESQNRLRREAEEKAKREAEELRRRRQERQLEEAEGKEKKEAEARARREAEESAKREAEERARRDAEEQARQRQEAEQRLETAQRAKREADERKRKEAEERARQLQEQQRLEARQRAKRETAERVRREQERQQQLEADERAKREAEERAKRERENLRRLETEEHTKREAAERVRREQEHQLEADERAKRETEEGARREQEEHVRLEAEQRAKRKAEEKACNQAKREAEEAPRKEGTVRARGLAGRLKRPRSKPSMNVDFDLSALSDGGIDPNTGYKTVALDINVSTAAEEPPRTGRASTPTASIPKPTMVSPVATEVMAKAPVYESAKIIPIQTPAPAPAPVREPARAVAGPRKKAPAVAIAGGIVAIVVLAGVTWMALNPSTPKSVTRTEIRKDSQEPAAAPDPAEEKTSQETARKGENARRQENDARRRAAEDRQRAEEARRKREEAEKQPLTDAAEDAKRKEDEKRVTE